MKLKEQMFSQFANSGLKELLTEYQQKYAPKKGMRFNKSNITYEIGAPRITDSSIEYEISSKIPQDEVPDQKGRDRYFTKVKGIVSKGKNKPVSVEMDNIVWDAEKETEKKREYVKLVYRHPFESLYDDKKIMMEATKIKSDPKGADIPKVPGVMTLAGKLVLRHLKENIVKSARKNMETFVKANEAVSAEISAK